MDRNFYYIGIAFFGMINGLFNQTWLLLFALIHMQILAPALLFGSVSLTLMFSSLMVSTATVILGGIPAALYERMHRRQGGTRRRLAVDLARRDGAAHPSRDGQFHQFRALTSAQRRVRKSVIDRPAHRIVFWTVPGVY